MEGVMMKNKEEYAVAVRKPNNEIVVQKSIYKDFSNKVKLFKLPIFRGMLAFVDSLVIGIKSLNFSASFFDDEEDSQTGNRKNGKNKKSDSKSKAADKKATESKASDDRKADDSKSNAALVALAVVLSIILSVALFMVLPALIIELFKKFISNRFLLSFVEGILRLAIFIGYVVLASMLTDIKRVFMYHGAEHKTINCLENGFELTVENVRWQSKQHKRCGTSFMLIVILVSLLIFIILPTTGLFWRVISRILLVPFIAGISYEFIRLAGRSDSRVVNIFSKPGLWMQRLTTKEPDDAMIEVAIKSVEAVFDWRAFLAENNKPVKTGSHNKIMPVVPNKGTGRLKKAKHSGSDEKISSGKKNRIGGKTEINSNNTETAAALEKVKVGYDIKKRSAYTTPVVFKNTAIENPDDEDDEILMALDKYFDDKDDINKENSEQSK